jgi:4-amino-4-deoxy-L-arabinose transferase-like glycosyltransferase
MTEADIDERKEELKKKIKRWFSNKYNIYLFLILIFSFVVRIFYFFLTKQQPLWWDEAEYMLKAKNMALGTPGTGFWIGRPILFPILLSSFYFIGLGEVSIRFSLLIVSLLTVYLVYLVGKKMFNEKIGLIASFLYSLVYINLFYSMRIMIDILHVTLGLLAFYFFFTKKSKLVWLVFPILAIGTLLRFTTFFFFVILVAYIFVTEKTSAFKNKDYWISVVLAFLISLPYLIWSQIKFGHPLYAIKVAGGGSVSGITFASGLAVLKQYIGSFPMYFHWLLLIIFLIGLVLFYDVFLGFDFILKNKGKEKGLKYKFLTLIWILIPLIYFGFGVSHYEDRYIFMTFPALFFVIALSIDKIQSFLKKYHKYLSVLFLIFVLIFGGYQLLEHSDDIIKVKASSFGPVKEAGLWIKDRTSEGDTIMTRSHPQNTYYSERASYSISANKSEFEKQFELLKPKFVVVSVFDSPPEWTFSIDTEKYGLTPVKAIPSDQPILIVYKTSF